MNEASGIRDGGVVNCGIEKRPTGMRGPDESLVAWQMRAQEARS